MNDSYPRLCTIKPDTLLTNVHLVLEFKEHCPYQSIIGSCLSLVICTRLNLIYAICYLLQFLIAPSKSWFTAAKYLLYNFYGNKDLKLTFFPKDITEITPE
jgi:hypothetical protein